jgi:cytochrome c553
MKKLVAVVLMVLFVASVAVAADMMTMKSKQGDVTFNHKVHGETAECKTCHGEGTPGKLTLGKDPAHKLCKGCHETKKAGPTKCPDCHKKK